MKRTVPIARSLGFSLIEILAALLLLAIAFAALMQVAGSSIGLTRNAADHSEAALWARSLLDTAGMEQKLQAGTTEGKFDKDYRWRLTVTPYQPGDAGNNVSAQMFKLDLDVMWGAPRERSAHFSTLRMVGAVPQQPGVPR
jgi:general secretion pathway protein I